MATAPGGTLYLIFTQVASRGLTFVGNQVVLRYVSPTLLGIAVQLEVLSTMVLYSSRESLRVALQRQPAVLHDSDAKEQSKNAVQSQYQSSINLSYLAIALGLLVSLVSGSWYFQSADPEALNSPYYTDAFYIYSAATLIELFAEPFFIVIQQGALFSQRARAETSGAIARTACACATALIGKQQGLTPSILPFAVGQLAYSIVLFALYFQAANSSAQQVAFSLIPRTMRTGPDYMLSLFKRPIVSLATTMYVQSIFKVLLSEGDHIIMGFLASLADQGAFALVHNYGGLLARLIFQPIEESSRNIFGRLLSAPEPQTQTPEAINSTSKPQPSKTNSKQPEPKPTTSTNTTKALTHLSTTLRLYLLLTLPLLSLIPPLIPSLAPLLLSSHWRNPATTSLLATYIYYIPFLAVNGILDAFVTSVAAPADIRRQSVAMAGITGVYGVVAWGLVSGLGGAGTSHGDEGMGGSEALIWAGMVNMSLRILWSIIYIRRWVTEKTGRDVFTSFWRSCTPQLNTVVVAAIVGGVLQSQYGIGATTRMSARGASAGAGTPGDGDGNGIWLTRLLHNLGVDLDTTDLSKIIGGAVVMGSTL